MIAGVAPVLESPLAGFCACIVWFPVGVWVISMLNWTIQGDVQAEFGIVAILVGLGMGFLTSVPPDPALGPWFFLLVLVTMAVYPAVRHFAHQRALAEIDLDAVRGAYDALALRPDNVSASIKLAEALYRRGLVGHAIGIAEIALQHAPPNVFQAEERLVQGWRVAANDPAYFAPVPCQQCGHKNPPGFTYCERCRGAYLLDYGRVMWMGPGVGPRVIASWAVGVVVLMGIPATAAADALPVEVKVALIVLQVAVSVVVLIRAFLKPEGE